MTTRDDFDERRAQREWEAQESALRAERHGAPAGRDTAVAQYRLIARALRNPPLDPLPSDLVARVAAGIALESRIASERVEVWLERGLVVLLLLAGAAAVAVYNGESLRELTSSLPEPAVLGTQVLTSWGFAIAACVGISWAFEGSRKRQFGS